MDIIDTLVHSPFASAAGAVAVAVTAGITNRWWQRRQEAQDDVEKWYQDSLGLIGRLQQAGHRTTTYQETDYSTLRKKLEPLSEDMQEHAASAPDGVEEEARMELIFLAAFSTGLITLSEQAEEFDGVEFFEHVQEHAQEMYDGEHDMEDVNELIDPLEADSLAEQMDKDVETDDDAIDEFLGHFSEESIEAGQPTTIDEALNMPVGLIDETVEQEDFLGEMLGDMMREYVRLILIDLTEEVFEAMEQRKKRA